MPDNSMVNVIPAKTSFTGDSSGFVKVTDYTGNSYLVATLVQTDDIADSSVTTPKIADANITTPKIADSSVTTPKIADANITVDKLADRSVTTHKVNATPATGILHNTHSDDADALEWGLTTTADIADDNVTISKLDADTRTIIQQTPQFERGISNSLEIPANSAVDGEITFTTAKVDTPQIFITVEDATGTNFSTVITSVNVDEFHYRIINNSNTDASGVTLNWLALSGR